MRPLIFTLTRNFLFSRLRYYCWPTWLLWHDLMTSYGQTLLKSCRQATCRMCHRKCYTSTSIKWRARLKTKVSRLAFWETLKSLMIKRNSEKCLDRYSMRVISRMMRTEKTYSFGKTKWQSLKTMRESANLGKRRRKMSCYTWLKRWTQVCGMVTSIALTTGTPRQLRLARGEECIIWETTGTVS